MNRSKPVPEQVPFPRLNTSPSKEVRGATGVNCVVIDLVITLLASEDPTRYFNGQYLQLRQKILVLLANMLHPRSEFSSWQSNWYRVN